MRKNSPITIRPVNLSDADRLHTMCWTQRTIENVVHLLQRTQKLAFNQRGLGVVALWHQTLCGFGMLTVWPRAAEISDLFVNAAYRRQGIGTAIITYLTNKASCMGVEALEIGAALSNPRALALYRRLGFLDGRTIELNLGNGPEPVCYLYKRLG